MVTGRISSTSIPLWPFVLTGVAGAWLLFQGRRAQRWAEEGRCVACGYDLRESRDRCPECGAAIAGAGPRRPDR